MELLGRAAAKDGKEGRGSRKNLQNWPAATTVYVLPDLSLRSGLMPSDAASDAAAGRA
jgi:hypothetical protein